MNDSLINNKTNITSYAKKSKSFKPLKILGYYFGIPLLLFIILFFVLILVLLIRRKIKKMKEKMRRMKLQNEINKILNLDIFETKSSSIDVKKEDFHSVSNDSLSDINTSTGSILSQINVKSELNSSRELTTI